MTKHHHFVLDLRTNQWVDVEHIFVAAGRALDNSEIGEALAAAGFPADPNKAELDAAYTVTTKPVSEPGAKREAKKRSTKILVAEHAAALRAMSHGELFAWSRANGLDSRAGFSAFKKALLAIGVDYDALRAGEQAERRAEMESQATAHLTLISDAKARTDRFAICDAKGEPVWYGKFFDSDRDYNGEQSSGEMAAAKKAVWLASKVKEAIGAAAIRLTLKVDAEWLTWANEVAAGGSGGGKARALGEAAQKLGVMLRVEHIAGANNPADQYTVAAGFKRWQDADLRALLSA